MPTKISHAFTVLALIVLLGGTSLCVGCGQRNLFADDTPHSNLKYFGDENDTAVGSRERHRQANEAPFGFANGPSMQ